MTAAYTMITTRAGLTRAVKKAGPVCALDFETTALRPEDGRVRLVSLCSDTLQALIDFDRIRGGFNAVAKLFDTGTAWVVFNAGFEMRWFQGAGVEPLIYDVQHLRQAILGGSNLNLARMAKFDLNEDISKEQQASNWGAKNLTQEQLQYAYDDADVTWRLWRYWEERADDEHMRCFKLINDLDLPIIEMEEAGMKLDPARHRKLVKHWEELRDDRLGKVRALVGPDEVSNVNSDGQWSDYFSRLLPTSMLRAWPKTEKSGQLSMKTDVLKRIAGQVSGTPLEEFLDALADYKTLNKYVTSFGETLATKADLSHDSRLRARFNIAAAKTCRFSCSGPNLQQIPRDKDDFFGSKMSIRSSFIAERNCRLVALDYSGIELRVLALLSGDEQLLEDVVYGDVHTSVAEYMAGRKIDKSVPADNEIRSDAKRVSFGIVYGSGAAGLAASLRSSVDRAQDLIDFWGRRYPKAFGLRDDKMDEAQRTRRIRMADGGTIHLGNKPELPKCANYPVQRAAWSIMARAISRHHDTLKDERKAGRQRGTKLISTIHDELIDEASSRNAQACYALLERDMTQAYLDIFPAAPTERLVEGGIGANWGAVK